MVNRVASVAGDDTPTEWRERLQIFLFLVPHALHGDSLRCLIAVFPVRVLRDHQQRHVAEALEPSGLIAYLLEIDEFAVVSANVGRPALHGVVLALTAANS